MYNLFDNNADQYQGYDKSFNNVYHPSIDRNNIDFEYNDVTDYTPLSVNSDIINHRELNPLYKEDRPSSIHNNSNRWEEEQLFSLERATRWDEEQLFSLTDSRTKSPAERAAGLPCFTMFATGKCNTANCLYTHIKTDMEKLWLSRQDALQQSPFAPRGQSRNSGNSGKKMFTLLTDKPSPSMLDYSPGVKTPSSQEQESSSQVNK